MTKPKKFSSVSHAVADGPGYAKNLLLKKAGQISRNLLDPKIHITIQDVIDVMQSKGQKVSGHYARTIINQMIEDGELLPVGKLMRAEDSKIVNAWIPTAKPQKPDPS